ncbi:MAG: L,D-transpeptidase family protein [Verrucomicrobia bacterium]|nr:L,D-transpeptidase family protein [Verrucomicrobiota bacterium]
MPSASEFRRCWLRAGGGGSGMVRLRTWSLRLLLVLGLMVTATAGGVPAECRQLLIASAPDWNTNQGTMQRYERRTSGGPWQPVGAPVPVLFGKKGLAWGIGVAGQEEPGLAKRERDGRTPAGVFALGKIYTADRALPPGSDYPFVTVTSADAWPDDPTNAYYNRFVSFPDPSERPPWFQKQRMKSTDWAYRWRIEIRHNSDPIQPGRGSAIFFHIRRGETRPSSGCTTMAEPELVNVVRWLRAPARPHYVVAPSSVLRAKAAEWRLPTPWGKAVN